MSGELHGKVAVVTGASKGIGLEIATRFARAGAAVMLSSRKGELLEKAITQIRSVEPAADVAYAVANAGNPDHAESCLRATMERFGAIDILINNAASNPYFGPLVEIDLPAWDKTLQVNLRGALVWTQLAWRLWMAEHGGAVILMSSTGAYHHRHGMGAYNISKNALIYMTKVLAYEMGPGVRLNALAPGLVKTDFARRQWEADPELAGRFPLGRLGTTEDIAEAALFLAGDGAAWVTGHTLLVDGGVTSGVRL